MRKKKKERLEEENFWNDFFYFNIPDTIDIVPEHIEKVNFRRYNADDRGLERMAEYVRSVNMLDLDETDITNEGIAHLAKLDCIKQLRLKKCQAIDDGCISGINKIKGLELLHIGGTPITTDGVLKLFIPGLKALYVSADTDDASKAKLMRFTKAFPECKIIVNHKAFDYYLTL